VETKEKYILQVKSKTENLAKVRDFIREIGSNERISSEITDKLVLAVDEACTNIMRHAYHHRNDQDIILKVEVKQGKVVVTITDFGEGFDPQTVPDPDMPTYMKQRRVGGLGLHLIRALMDKVEYQTIPNNYNRLVLQKNYN
jgi:serine/threonine-protein kinase RsbW